MKHFFKITIRDRSLILFCFYSRAKSTCILLLIQSVCFIAEVISFYSSAGTSIFFELLNALQGFFILIMFIFLPNRWLIIQQWWSGDQGSFVVENSRNNLNNKRAPEKPRKAEERPLNGQEIGNA